MVAAHQSNLAEVAAGTAAQEHAASEAVRELGAMLIKDHQALDADLTAAAEEFGVELPTAPSAAQQAALEKVMAQKGEAFDAAWIASQIEGHRMSLAAGEEQIVSGSDPTAIALAEASAPVIQGHLDHALQLAEDSPDSVPSGLGSAGAPAPLGVVLIVVGLLAVTASLLLVRRDGGARA